MYTFTSENILNDSNEEIECGHLICDEESTLRLNDVLRESDDYIFQIKIKSSTAAIFYANIQNTTEEITTTPSWQRVIKKFSNVDTTSIKYIDLTFSAGEYWFYNAKLETGSISSAWSLSIDDLAQKIDLVESNLNQRANEIEMSISSKRNNQTAIRYIRDWLNGSNVNNGNHWVECQVIKNSTSDNGKINLSESSSLTAKDVSLNVIPLSNIDVYTDSKTDTKSYAYGNNGYKTCIEIDLGDVYYDIDYITVWHYYADNRIYNHQLQISSDGKAWFSLYDSDKSGGYRETKDGYTHIITNTLTMQVASLKVDTNSVKGQIESIDGRVSSTETSIDHISSMMASDRETLKQTRDTLNNLQLNYNNKFSENDKFVSETKQTLNGLSETYAKITDVDKQITNIKTSAYGWQGLFAMLDMYNDPSIQTNVSIDINGITVTNPKTGQTTKMRIDGFSGWNNNDKIFWIEGDTTKTRRLLCEKGWDTDVIKMTTDTFTINGRTLSGVSFVKSGGTS